MKWRTFKIYSKPKPITNGIEDNTAKTTKRIRWRPTSTMELVAAEAKLLAYLTYPYETMQVDMFIPIGTNKLTNVKIQTVIVNKECSKSPLVMLHGLCLGLGVFPFLTNAICKDRPVYLMDLPGFGRSSRIKFPKKAEEVEKTFIQILEAWRSAVGLETFIIVGHSLGGFLATSYTLQHPERVEHLVALDPWGYPEKPERVSNLMGMENRVAITLLAMSARQFNVCSPVRKLGPLGPIVAKTMVKDFYDKLGKYGKGIKEAVTEYHYHCNAEHHPSGELAFRTMMKWCVYAKNPICRRLHLFSVPLTIIYPESTYVPSLATDELRQLLNPQIELNVHKILASDHEDMIFCDTLRELLPRIL